MYTVRISIALLALGIACGPARSLEVGQVITHRGMCEPSGAVAFPEGSFGRAFLVANDQNNVLRAYDAASGTRIDLAGGDLNKTLGLDPTDDDKRADFEAATWLGGKIYWMGSQADAAIA